MRHAIRAALSVVWGAVLLAPAGATTPSIVLVLPAGPLANAVAALSRQAHINVAAVDPALLRIALPAITARGRPDAVLRVLAHSAHIGLHRLNADTWRITRPPPVSPASFLEPAPAPPAEIVVQASKRGAMLADDAMEVVRLDGAEIARDARPDTTSLLDRAPGLSSTGWGAGREKLFLRGVADTSFTGGSPALVGEYLGDLRLTYAEPDPDLRLYDVADVEILEGPQGTLYGSGAMGGIVRVDPRAPDLSAYGGSIWTGATTVSHGGLAADGGTLVNIPLVHDALAVRGLAYRATEPGYVDDPTLGVRNVNRSIVWGWRAAVRWAIAPGWSADIGSVGQTIRNADAPYSDMLSAPYDQDSPLLQPSYNRFRGEYLTVRGTLGTVELRSTVGLIDQRLGELFDVAQTSGIAALYNQVDHARALSQDLQLSGTLSGGSWVIGETALSNRASQDQQYGTANILRDTARLRNDIRELKLYGEIDHRIMPHVSTTLGAQYDRVTSTGYATDQLSLLHKLLPLEKVASVTTSKLLPSAGLLFRMGKGVSAFARYERGFRPGGLTLADPVQTYASDHLASFEWGMRRSATQSRYLGWSVTTAYTRWRHIQADLLDGEGFPYVINIGDGHIVSVDAAIELHPFAHVTANLSGFLVRSKLSPVATLSSAPQSDDLPDVAHDGGLLTLSYEHELAGTATLELRTRLQRIGHSLPGLGLVEARSQGGFETLAVNAAIVRKGLRVSADATNLTNSRAVSFAFGSPFAGVRPQAARVQPRTLRVGVQYNF